MSSRDPERAASCENRAGRGPTHLLLRDHLALGGHVVELDAELEAEELELLLGVGPAQPGEQVIARHSDGRHGAGSGVLGSGPASHKRGAHDVAGETRLRCKGQGAGS